MSLSDQYYSYDIALSYAGEDRDYVDAIATILHSQGVRVFYDKYEKATLWGQDLYTYLSDIYQNKARYCVMFLSKHYAAKLWTTHERQAAQARSFRERSAYILPIRLDETEIPGILPTTAYITWDMETAESIVHIILEKLEGVIRKSKQEYLNESNDLYRKGYRERALIASELAVRIDPYDSYVHCDKGSTLLGLRRDEEALASFNRAVELYHNNDTDYIYDVFCGKGQALANLERYEEALEAYEQAIQLDLGKDALYRIRVSGALCSKGDILRALEQYDEALTTYDRAIQLEKDQSYLYHDHICEALCGKGNVFLALERYDEALAVCEKAIQIAPKNVYGYNVKGYVLHNLEQNEEALTVFDHAIQLEPKHAYAHQFKAYTLYCLERYEEALIASDQAIPLDSEDPDIYGTKGDILKALKRYDEAEQAYEMARRRGYVEEE